MQAKWVEVKSPNDHLSLGQKWWLQELRAMGIDAEVCRVQDRE
jgi:VRR-NUC domain